MIKKIAIDNAISREYLVKISVKIDPAKYPSENSAVEDLLEKFPDKIGDVGIIDARIVSGMVDKSDTPVSPKKDDLKTIEKLLK